jgi:hypothetical protein
MIELDFTKRIRVTRDTDVITLYNIHYGDEEIHQTRSVNFTQYYSCHAEQNWESQFPTLRLEPGEGPYEVELVWCDGSYVPRFKGRDVGKKESCDGNLCFELNGDLRETVLHNYNGLSTHHDRLVFNATQQAWVKKQIEEAVGKIEKRLEAADVHIRDLIKVEIACMKNYIGPNEINKMATERILCECNNFGHINLAIRHELGKANVAPGAR